MLEVISANLPMGLCLVLGAGLMIIEIFLPGFGLPGISGIVLIAAGVVLSAVHHGMLVAVVTLLVVIALLALIVSWVLRYAANGKHYSQIFLSETDDLHTKEDMQVLVGRIGCTASVLRPAGIANFDGVRLNVVTEGGFIDRNVPVEIVSVDGTRIVVRPRQEA